MRRAHWTTGTVKRIIGMRPLYDQNLMGDYTLIVIYKIIFRNNLFINLMICYRFIKYDKITISGLCLYFIYIVLYTVTTSVHQS